MKCGEEVAQRGNATASEGSFECIHSVYVHSVEIDIFASEYFEYIMLMVFQV